jgi:hypothetical protein
LFALDKISIIENLLTLINLECLYIVHNQIRTIENVSTLVNLRVLELGDNRIQVSSMNRLCERMITFADDILENRKFRYTCSSRRTSFWQE